MAGWLVVAGVSGFLGVALGAFGAHALQDLLDARGQDLWHTAVQYQMMHALALLGVSLLTGLQPTWRLAPAGYAFAAGSLVFCGTLYALALGAPRWVGAITPLGGVALLLGWAFLVWTAMREVRQ